MPCWSLRRCLWLVVIAALTVGISAEPGRTEADAVMHDQLAQFARGGYRVDVTWPTQWPEIEPGPDNWELLSGSGHGQNLVLTTVQVTDGVVTLHRIRWRGGYIHHPARSAWEGDSDQADFSTVTVDWSHALPYLSAWAAFEQAAFTIIRSVPLEDPDARVSGGHAFSTTSDSVAAFQHATQSAVYYDYFSSHSMHEYIRPTAIAAVMRAWDHDLTWELHPPDLADQAMLEKFWLRHADHLVTDPDQRWWWVEERLLGLAGTCPLPPLRTQLFAIVTRPISEKDSSLTRSRLAAITALAQATGRDFRFDAAGQPRPIEDIIADYRQLLAATAAD